MLELRLVFLDLALQLVHASLQALQHVEQLHNQRILLRVNHAIEISLNGTLQFNPLSIRRYSGLSSYKVLCHRLIPWFQM